MSVTDGENALSRKGHRVMRELGRELLLIGDMSARELLEEAHGVAVAGRYVADNGSEVVRSGGRIGASKLKERGAEQCRGDGLRKGIYQ